MRKVLLPNGGPRCSGCTRTALKEAADGAGVPCPACEQVTMTNLIRRR